MKKHLLLLALLLSGISPAQALDVGDISSFMNSDSSTLSKTIKNSTDSGRLINIRLERLSSPLDDGQVIAMDKPDELLLTPASLLLPAQASEVIRFFIFISPVARVARTISESAALLSGWIMDSYASGKYSWKRVKITPVSANKLDSS